MPRLDTNENSHAEHSTLKDDSESDFEEIHPGWKLSKEFRYSKNNIRKLNVFFLDATIDDQDDDDLFGKFKKSKEV